MCTQKTENAKYYQKNVNMCVHKGGKNKTCLHCMCVLRKLQARLYVREVCLYVCVCVCVCVFVWMC